MAMVRLDDGGSASLRPGDILGRSRAAALQLNDPRVSEVHAYVSLRGGALVLFALRGSLLVDGIGASEVTLSPGLEVWLSPTARLVVESVVVPERVLALSVDGGPARPLVADLLSVRRDGSLVEGFDSDAIARLWRTADRWFLDVGAGAQPVGPLLNLEVGGHRLRTAWAPVAEVSSPPTEGRSAYPPLRVTTRWDSAQVQHLGGEAVLLSGMAARVLSELVDLGGSARWEIIAGEIWKDDEVVSLRARWDKALASLRKKLDQGGIRPDLVQSAAGIVELVLYPTDHVESEEP
jgi:hypothetical protein